MSYARTTFHAGTSSVCPFVTFRFFTVEKNKDRVAFNMHRSLKSINRHIDVNGQTRITSVNWAHSDTLSCVLRFVTHMKYVSTIDRISNLFNPIPMLKENLA